MPDEQAVWIVVNSWGEEFDVFSTAERAMAEALTDPDADVFSAIVDKSGSAKYVSPSAREPEYA